jgi:hypothetical protein
LQPAQRPLVRLELVQPGHPQPPELLHRPRVLHHRVNPARRIRDRHLQAPPRLRAEEREDLPQVGFLRPGGGGPCALGQRRSLSRERRHLRVVVPLPRRQRRPQPRQEGEEVAGEAFPGRGLPVDESQNPLRRHPASGRYGVGIE